MVRSILFSFVLASLVLVFSPAVMAIEFSADMFMMSDGHEMRGKMYAGESRFRMEINEPERIITITRLDRNVAYNIMPDEGIYMEIPFNPNQVPKVDIEGEMSRELVGRETVNGHPAEKYLVTHRSGGKTEKIYQWMATDINFPIKTADVNGTWVQEYRNVRIGRQPGDLFEVPAGYEKMDMPGMYGGMPGGTPPGMGGQMPPDMPEGMPPGMRGQMPPDMPGGMPPDMPDDIRRQMQERMRYR